MSDPLSRLPPLSSGRDQMHSDASSTSNIPISDFRRNEARPIIDDDGNSFVLQIFDRRIETCYLHLNFRLDRHKSIYHQPSLSTYNPSERRRKRHRRPRQATEPSEMSFKSVQSNETSDSRHMGKFEEK